MICIETHWGPFGPQWYSVGVFTVHCHLVRGIFFKVCRLVDGVDAYKVTKSWIPEINIHTATSIQSMLGVQLDPSGRSRVNIYSKLQHNLLYLDCYG